MPKTVAYLRVSTLDQDSGKNKADILRFANDRGIGKVHFVEEVASGRTPWRAPDRAGVGGVAGRRCHRRGRTLAAGAEYAGMHGDPGLGHP